MSRVPTVRAMELWSFFRRIVSLFAPGLLVDSWFDFEAHETRWLLGTLLAIPRGLG